MSTLAPALEDDFPELALHEVVCRVEATKRMVRARLRALDDRIDGPRAFALRTQAAPAAYRAFARQVGLDPEADPDPLNQLLRARLTLGTMPSYGPIPDACAVGLVETGVPVWGLDGALVVAALRIGIAPDLGLVVTDGDRTIAPLLLPPEQDLLPTKATTIARLYALRVRGVSEAQVHAALAAATEVLRPR